MAYNLWKCEIDSINIEAERIQNEWAFLRNEKTRADLNFWAMDLKFKYVLNSFMTYNLWKFEIDSIEIEAWATLSLLISKPLKIGFCHVCYC